MRELDLNEIKRIELSMLIKFVELAEQYKLKYVLCGGTLLGAIRHKGFIPWDDDIDVAMPREDYERLIQIMDQSKELEYRAINKGSSKHPFVKIVDTRTHIETKYAEAPDIAYVWVDVFPIDMLPADERKNRKAFGYVRLLKRCLDLSLAKNGTGTTLAKKVLKIPMSVIPKLLGTYFWGKRINEYCIEMNSQEKQSNYMGVLCWGYGPQERMPKDEWLQRTKVEFEGHQFWAPGCWHEYLTNLYGDYMQLPPVEKRVTHNMKAWITEDEE